MTPSSSPPVPPDPTCAIWSKPIRSGFIHTKGGEAIHIRCRTQQLHLDALDQWDRTRLAIEDREILGQRLRHLRATESEAWLATRDGTVMGALIIRTVRPDGPT